jgi:hemolysin activation/secretion protein
VSALVKSPWVVTAEAQTAVVATVTNAVVKKGVPTLDVRGYLVEGNTVLPPGDFAMLTNYTGANLTFPQLREGLGKLQLRYRELGFPTISVTLPQQKLTNGIVRVKVVEGRLSKIIVEDNRYFSSNNVLRAVPSLTTNILLNTKWLQPELDRANANADRQIYPVIAPGVDAGTTELTLKVKDRLPLHGHVEINDKSTPETPLLRLDTALQYDNLWQADHQIGIEYNFSPQDMKPSDVNPAFFDEPAVASYSGFYRIPIHFDESLRETYERLPVNFGYDQVTHRFNLPAPTGVPEFIFFASRSTSDTGYRLGPTNALTTSATLDVDQQIAERNPTVNGDVGTKFMLPLREWNGVQSSVSVGLDFKSYQASSLVTSFTTIQLYSTNPPALLGSQTVTNFQNSGNSLYYLPLSWGWSGSRADSQGSWSFLYNQNLFLPPLQSGRRDFQNVAGSAEAGGTYTSITAGLVRQQNLPANWSVVANANGQWASEPLINNEQFALGGTSGVRGYREGETYGDSGWRAQFDLRAPPINVGYFPVENGDVPAALRCSWFMDYGESYHLIPAVSDIQQWGAGFGLYLTVGEHVDARLTLAWALHDTPGTPAGSAQAYFSIGVQF